MSKKLQLADDLALPIEAVTEKLAFLGRTGSGKTYAAMKLAELMLDAGAQIGVLDPVGVWRALRVPAGKAARSFEVVVFGGLSGDLPLEPTAGALVADVVSDRGIAFVLDVSQWIPSEQQRFVRAFADRFFMRRKAVPGAIHLFIEECQEFIPQNPMGDEAHTLHAFQRLWKIGRNFGIGGSLISQRPQEINKKALNMSGTLFAFQMTAPQERAAVKGWVADQGVAVDIERMLQKLEVGQPHVESPMFLQVSKTVRILPRETADLSSGATVGAAAAAKRPLTPLDVEQLKAAMADTIERAKADDPKELRKKITELRTELSTHLADKARRMKELEDRESRSPAAKIEVPILTEADRKLLQELREDFQTFSTDIGARGEGLLGSMVNRARAAIDEAAQRWTDELTKRRLLFLEHLDKARVQRVLDKLEQMPAKIASAEIVRARESIQRGITSADDVRQRERDIWRVTVTPAPAAGSGDAMAELGTSGAYRMLVALAQHAPQDVTLSKLAIRTGIARTGGTFRTYLGKLKTLGWAQGNGHGVRITAEGQQALGEWAPLPSGAELVAYWQRELGESGARRMFDALVHAYPNALSHEELEAATGIARAGGTYRTYLGKLRTLDLVERRELRASEELFG